MAWADKRWDDAVALYRTSVEVHPAYENGLWGLARVLAEAGRPVEAAKAWNQAVAQAPDSYPVAYHHAAFLQSQGRFDDAEREWRRAVELVDEPADAYLGLARTLAARGRPGDRDAARREARRALAADPAHVEARRFVKEAR
jgi:tetratricopeptide (TPR) repeat protein